MFEAALGISLIGLVLFSPGLRMAAPASHPLIIAIAILLLLIAAALVALAQRAAASMVAVVALANVTSAFIIAFWLLAGWQAFSSGGQFIAWATVAGLIVLAVIELLATTIDEAED